MASSDTVSHADSVDRDSLPTTPLNPRADSVHTLVERALTDSLRHSFFNIGLSAVPHNTPISTASPTVLSDTAESHILRTRAGWAVTAGSVHTKPTPADPTSRVDIVSVQVLTCPADDTRSEKSLSSPRSSRRGPSSNPDTSRRHPISPTPLCMENNLWEVEATTELRNALKGVARLAVDLAKLRPGVKPSHAWYAELVAEALNAGPISFDPSHLKAFEAPARTFGDEE